MAISRASFPDDGSGQYLSGYRVMPRGKTLWQRVRGSSAEL